MLKVALYQRDTPFTGCPRRQTQRVSPSERGLSGAPSCTKFKRCTGTAWHTAHRPSSPLPSAAVSNVHITTKIPKEAVHLRSAPPEAIRAALRCELRVVKQCKHMSIVSPLPQSANARLPFAAASSGLLHRSPAKPHNWFLHRTRAGSALAPLRDRQSS